MQYSTSTITNDNKIVPRLAAEGPLAYSPLSPPMKDYYFLYNFMFSGIFSQNVNLRSHYWFGDFSGKDGFNVRFLKAFWEDARCGRVHPVCIREPIQDLMQLEAPIAIFKYHSKVFRQSYYQ